MGRRGENNSQELSEGGHLLSDHIPMSISIHTQISDSSSGGHHHREGRDISCTSLIKEPRRKFLGNSF